MKKLLTATPFLVAILLSLASPQVLRGQTLGCANATRAAVKPDSVRVSLVCKAPRDTVKVPSKPDTVTVTKVRVDTVYLPKPDTAITPPKDTVVTPPPVTGTVLLEDDFEDGDWYTLDCDAARRTSAGLAGQDGWCGTIYANPITPAKAAVCGGKGAKGTNCAASYGTKSGSDDQRNMADYLITPVTELWARWYYKADAGYQWGAQKSTNFTKRDGDIAWFNIQFNCGAGGASSSALPVVQIIKGTTTGCYNPNVSNVSLTAGKWYYFEAHLKLNAPGASDGLIELWINDCGAGTCTGSPTLRTRLTGLAFDRNQSGCAAKPCAVEDLWFENWANPKSKGTDYLDQIKVATKGPIGF